jgi:eukaryotic-like serine/threonine-protein kinase
MTAERWEQIKEVFCGALEQSEGERAAWLDTACGADDLLRAEVERLLAQDDGSMKSPAAAVLAQTTPELAAGDLLSHYRVEVKVGQGGMGAVYRAYDTRLRRQVALKILPPDFADPGNKQRLMREARAASALNHPNIVSVHEVGSETGVNFIAMEFVEGKTLGEVIPAKGLPLTQALDCAVQIASGLAKAHAAGLIHRDLKPGNIMVAAEGLVKLLDFGLARRVHLDQQESATLTVEGVIAGTPAYMSPEQAEGKALDARSDVFLFGAVLYEMLAGRPAFAGKSTADVLAAVLREEPAPLAEKIPHELQKIIARCLRKDLARRFQHIDDVKVELEELKATSHSGQLLEVAPAEPRRCRRWRWIAAVSLATVAAILVGAWLFPGHDIDVSKYEYTPVATVMHQRRIEEGGGLGAHMPAWSPDGKNIVYSADGLRLQRIDSTESLKLTDRGMHPFFSPEGTRIYYLTSGQTPHELWSVSVAGGQPERVLGDLGGHSPMIGGAAMSRDGKALVVVRPRKPGDEELSLWISSPPGAAPRPYPGSPGRRRPNRVWLHFSPDGSKLLVTLAAADEKPVEWWLLRWPPPAAEQAGAVRRLFEAGPRGFLGFTGDWLPDNRHLVVSVPAEGEFGGPLWIADTLKGTWRRLTPGPVAYHPPRVSRDGRVLVGVVRADENAIEIPLDGSAIRPLLGGFRKEQYPAWSSVGEQMLFVTNERGRPEIWLASRKEGRRRPLVTQQDFPPGNGLQQFVSPVFSPDGTRIAYGSKKAIWVSPVAGGLPVRMCSGWAAAWSPDGGWLAIATDPWSSENELIRVPVGHPQDAVVIQRAVGTWLPRWSPDGKWITIQLPEGFGVISPDGARRKILRKGMLDWGSACGWSREGSTLYLAYLTPKGRVLSAFDVASGAERRMRDLGTLHFSYFAMSTTGLSPSPDGKSLAASTLSLRFEPWIIDGIEPPRTFWSRLFRPW